MRIKRDQITGAVLILLGAVVFLMTTTFSTPITAAYPGPRMLPSIAAFGFAVCGLGILVESTLSKKEQKAYMAKAGWVRMGASLIIITAYIAVMTAAGYLIATPAACMCSQPCLQEAVHPLKGRLLFSVAVAVIIYVIYVYAFGLTLPSGMLFE